MDVTIRKERRPIIETTIDVREYRVIGVVIDPRKSPDGLEKFKAFSHTPLGPDGNPTTAGTLCEWFDTEEVHPDERHLIAIGACFIVRQLRCIEAGQKARLWRVEFGLVNFQGLL